MKFGKWTGAALMGAVMMMADPGQAGAAKIIGSITTDSNGNGSLVLPLLGRRLPGYTHLTFKTPFAVTSQVIGTSTERVTDKYFGGPLIGFYNHVQKTPIQTTTDYQTIYSVFATTPLYLPNRQYSFFYNLRATLNISSTPDTLINYQMSLFGLPEPSTWALMILGFGGIGAAMRRRASVGRVTARVSYSG